MNGQNSETEKTQQYSILFTDVVEQLFPRDEYRNLWSLVTPEGISPVPANIQNFILRPSILNTTSKTYTKNPTPEAEFSDDDQDTSRWAKNSAHGLNFCHNEYVTGHSIVAVEVQKVDPELKAGAEGEYEVIFWASHGNSLAINLSNGIISYVAPMSLSEEMYRKGEISERVKQASKSQDEGEAFRKLIAQIIQDAIEQNLIEKNEESQDNAGHSSDDDPYELWGKTLEKTETDTRWERERGERVLTQFRESIDETYYDKGRIIAQNPDEDIVGDRVYAFDIDQRIVLLEFLQKNISNFEDRASASVID